MIVILLIERCRICLRTIALFMIECSLHEDVWGMWKSTSVDQEITSQQRFDDVTCDDDCVSVQPDQRVQDPRRVAYEVTGECVNANHIQFGSSIFLAMSSFLGEFYMKLLE